MEQVSLTQCQNGCCHFIDGKPARREEYEEAKKRHPGAYPGVPPGHRNAIWYGIIACQKNPKKQ